MKKYFYFLLLAIIFEILICNFSFFRYYFSKQTNSTELSLNACVLGQGIQQINTNTFLIIDKEQSYIEFNNIYNELDSLYINAKHINSEKNDELVKINLEIRDEGNINYYTISEAGRSILLHPAVELSNWLELECYGKVNSLKINFNLHDGDEIQIDNITINKPHPFNLNIFRILCFYLVIILIFKRNTLLCAPLFPLRKKYKLIILITILLNCAISIFHFSNIKFHIEQNQKSDTLLQYSYLAQSFSHRVTYLEKDVPTYIKNMSNPYDTIERTNLASCNNEGYMWDTAYFNGKYYVYFGVLPVILFHLPYYLLTHNVLLDIWPCFLICIGIWIVSFRLLYIACKRWNVNIPFIIYLLASECISICSGTFFLLSDTGIYEIVIALGIFLAMSGLCIWLQTDYSSTPINLAKLFLGSLCYALIMASRPPIFFAILVAFPLFKKLIFSNSKLVIQKNAKQLLALSLPFLIIALLLMYYNYIRFGNILDFGANYNLTTNDMTKRGFRFTRTGYGIWYYFFQPFNISSIFPFFKPVENSSEYLGTIIQERGYGGCLWIAPILLSLRNLFRTEIRKTEFGKIGLCILFASLTIVLLDSNIAGYVSRYFYDFIWMLLFAAIICAFYKINISQNTISRNSCHKIIMILFISILFGILISYSDVSNVYKECCSETYLKFKYMIEVWK